PPPNHASPATGPDHRPLIAAAQALTVIFALLLLPLVFRLLPSYDIGIVLALALGTGFVAGWAARLPRAGALAAPVVLLAAALNVHHWPALTPERFIAAMLALAAFAPLCCVAGQAAGRLRRWEERLVGRARRRAVAP